MSLLRRLGLCIALAVAPGALAAQVCAEDRVQLRGDFGEAAFAVELADDPQERNLGLMHRPSMPMGAGMLFVYERPQPVSFWMKNTLIPLDMLFFDADGVLQHVHENAVPGDLTGIPGGDAIQYVLEINGGLSRMLGLSPGAELRHPALPASANWPCPPS